MRWRDAGFFRIFRPASRRDGLELDPVTAFRVFEELSRIDSAVGWNVTLANIDHVYLAAGRSAIRDEQPFQRYFRDVHVITQHAFVSPSRFEAVGQIMLGLEPDWPFFQL
jgi:alkylation response protein AidB-like acyl-CoA dehydrogenase